MIYHKLSLFNKNATDVNVGMKTSGIFQLYKATINNSRFVNVCLYKGITEFIVKGNLLEILYGRK